MTGYEVMRLAERAQRAEAARRLRPGDAALADRADEARGEYETARRTLLQQEPTGG